MNTDTPLTDAAFASRDVEEMRRAMRDLERRLAASCEDARSNGMGCLLVNHYEHRLRVAAALLTRARNNVSLPLELYSDIQDFLHAPL